MHFYNEYSEGARLPSEFSFACRVTGNIVCMGVFYATIRRSLELYKQKLSLFIHKFDQIRNIDVDWWVHESPLLQINRKHTTRTIERAKTHTNFMVQIKRIVFRMERSRILWHSYNYNYHQHAKLLMHEMLNNEANEM